MMACGPGVVSRSVPVQREFRGTSLFACLSLIRGSSRDVSVRGFPPGVRADRSCPRSPGDPRAPRTFRRIGVPVRPARRRPLRRRPDPLRGRVLRLRRLRPPVPRPPPAGSSAADDPGRVGHTVRPRGGAAFHGDGSSPLTAKHPGVVVAAAPACRDVRRRSARRVRRFQGPGKPHGKV